MPTPRKTEPPAQGSVREKVKRKVTPLKAIRRKCYECMGGDLASMREKWVWHGVEDCSSSTCPLFAFRGGKNRRKKLSATHIAKLAEAGKRTQFQRQEKPL